MLLGSQVSGEYFVEEMALEWGRGSAGTELSVRMSQLQGPVSALLESKVQKGIHPPFDSPATTIGSHERCSVCWKTGQQRISHISGTSQGVVVFVSGVVVANQAEGDDPAKTLLKLVDFLPAQFRCTSAE